MKIRVSDYIADFLVEKGLTQVFTVVGGGAMFLNDSLGHHENIHSIYNHHEQASAMAAEGYTKSHGTMAVVCVTSGPGAVNALTGVVGAYQDSIPMLVLSGQVKSTMTIQSTGLPLRTIGGQEVDIVPVVQQNLVKYARMITVPETIKYYLEKACHIAVSGRPGPCWLDIPLDIQGSYIETDGLQGFQECSEKPVLSGDIINTVIEKLKTARRPVLYAGNGIRLSQAVELFHELISAFKIPVVTCWDSIDLIATDDPYYCGRGGNMGDRAGNFAVQNSDLVISLGARLSVYQVGWNIDTWARSAYIIANDIDANELKKPTLRVDLPVCADVSGFMAALLARVKKEVVPAKADWVRQCQRWKESYPVVQAVQYEEKNSTNVYAFIDTLSRRLPENAVTVVANGSASVVGSQTYYIKKKDRFIMNCAISSMGYALPAAVGAAVDQSVICIEGDGSLMMNLQELQTVVTNKLPIKLFVINNNGYHQIRLTQTNLFNANFVGIGPESEDLGFPDFKKIAAAFGIPYVRIMNNDQLLLSIDHVLLQPGPILCEVLVSTTQGFEPKSSTKRLPNGALFSPPLEDMAPFLSREELKKNMYISVIEEK